VWGLLSSPLDKINLGSQEPLQDNRLDSSKRKSNF
jgi:hypothetical protein